MPAIAGHMSSAEAPPSCGHLDVLESALRPRAEGAAMRVHCGVVSMVARQDPLPGDAVPLGSAGEVVLAMDARLDHLGELRGLVDAPGDAGDADLLAALYGRLGPAVFERLHGDYAVALWDSRRRRLVLARDAFGARPLYYHPDPGGEWLWASNLDALLAVRPELGEPLDDDWIAGFLTTGLPSDRSVYAQIRTVPPGHVVIFDAAAGTTTTRRFWRPEELPPTRLAGDAEYEARYRALLTEAVACRLAQPKPAFAELSGGLDSSSIVCVADRLLRRGAVAATGLETVSYVFDRSTTSDERRWIRPIEEHTGRPALHVLESEAPYLESFEEAPYSSPSVMSCFGPRVRMMAERMRRRGARTLLSGLAGDQVVSAEFPIPLQLGDLAADGRWLALAREVGRWRGHDDSPNSHLLVQGVVPLLLPAVLARRWRRKPELTPWIADDFARRHDVHARYEGAPQAAPARFRWPSQRTRFEIIQHIVHGAVTTINDDYGRFGCVAAYPFLDRRLVEFCLTVPVDQLNRPGQGRSLVRRSLAGIVPDVVLHRPCKGSPEEAMMRAILRQWPNIERLFAGDAEVYRRGYVDRGRLRAALARRRAGDAATNRTEMVIYLEAWLRAREARSSTRPARPPRPATPERSGRPEALAVSA